MIKNYLKFYKIKTFKYSWRYNVTSNLYYFLTWNSSHDNGTKILELEKLLLKEKIIENIHSKTYFKNKYILQNSIENISAYLNFLKWFLRQNNERAKVTYREIERIHSELMNNNITNNQLVKNNKYSNNNIRLSPIDIFLKKNNKIVFYTTEIETIWNLDKIEKELNFYNQKIKNKKNKKFSGWTMTITIIIDLIYK